MTDNKEKDDTIGSFYMGRMRPPPPPPQRVMPKGLLTILTLIGFAAIIWYAYPQGQEKYVGTDVPVIKADTAAYKFKPDDPGGMEVRHQDSTIFDPLEKKAAGEAEKLMPSTEEPVDKDAVAGAKGLLEKEEPKLNLDTQMQKVAEGTEKVVFPKKPEKKPATEKEKTASKKTVKTPDEKEKTAAKKADDKKTDAKKDKPAAEPEKEPETDKTAKAAPKPSAGGVFVRVGSYRNKTGALDDWKMMQKKYPQYLGELDTRIIPVDLGAKGTFHRLEAGSVTDARAREICAALAKTPGGCIVVK
jgi:hypothetical protein